MSLLDPIVPILGPFGQVLAASDQIVVGLGLFGLVCLGLHFAKRTIFETSKSWVGATVALSLLTILFRGMNYLCGCAWYIDPNTGDITQLVPLTYLLISGSFFAILFNFNIPKLKKFKWVISIALSIPLALASDIFLPLVPTRPAWLFLEILFMAPIGAIYSSFVYEKAVMHMGEYRARLRRFFEQTEKGKKGGVELSPEKQGFSYFTYGLLGHRLVKIIPWFNSLKGILSLAGMKIGHKAYISMMLFAAIVGTGVSFAVWLLLLSVGIGPSIGFGFAGIGIIFTVLAAMVLSVITGAMILGVFYMIPFMKMGSRRQRLDQFLPFTSSYMTVLPREFLDPLPRKIPNSCSQTK